MCLKTPEINKSLSSYFPSTVQSILIIFKSNTNFDSRGVERRAANMFLKQKFLE